MYVFKKCISFVLVLCKFSNENSVICGRAVLPNKNRKPCKKLNLRSPQKSGDLLFTAYFPVSIFVPKNYPQKVSSFFVICK